MIWKTQHIVDEAKQGEQFILDVIEKQPLPRQKANCFRIGIVGGGPKGMYALDQLCEEIRKNPLPSPIEVLWFNINVDFGCGPNYQIHQPDYLLINYCIGHIDAWLRSDSTTTDDRLNVLEWIRRFCRNGDTAKPTDFASRALVGYYLQFTAMQVICSVPPQIRLFLIPEETKNIELQPDQRFLLHTRSEQWRMDNILLATGHCYENNSLIASGDVLPSSYMSRAYPVHHLDDIPSESHVGIAGLGLTFIDVALHLTEGRGGQFNTEGNYIPSGKEPVLFPFSRHHLPILPRGPIYGRDTYILHYLHEDWIKQMEEIHQKRKIDFSKEIYPILEKEVQFAYYSTLLQTHHEPEVEHYIHSLKENQRFGLDNLLFPKIARKETLQRTYIDYLESLIREAEKGELQSPLMAAAAVWREVTPIIGKWYKAGGFTGDSQRKLDKELFGAFCRTSFGPPVENMKKIVSLIKSGIIRIAFEHPVDVLYQDDSNSFTLKSTNTEVEVDFIIDARIARPNLAKNNAALYSMLSHNRLLTPLENETYQPGCPSMDENGRSVIDGKTLHLYFYGSNTEGFLLDNDSLSRTKNNLATPWVTNTIQQMLNASDEITSLDSNNGTQIQDEYAKLNEK